VILPDVRGLHPFYRDLADRFAEVGVHAAVMDYFGRTAGTEARAESFDFMDHVMKTKPDNIARDVSATIAHLRSPRGGAADSIHTVGFCFGGRNSFNQAARGHGLRGVIGFYGRVEPADADDHNAPIDFVEGFECPVLGFFGGADQGIPVEGIDRFRAALDEHRVANELIVYDGAPHSFFDRSYDQHRQACDDAWRHMLDFLGIAVPADF
jgi:carboxymethylenebutenolidase